VPSQRVRGTLHWYWYHEKSSALPPFFHKTPTNPESLTPEPTVGCGGNLGDGATRLSSLEEPTLRAQPGDGDPWERWCWRGWLGWFGSLVSPSSSRDVTRSQEYQPCSADVVVRRSFHTGSVHVLNDGSLGYSPPQPTIGPHDPGPRRRTSTRGKERHVSKEGVPRGTQEPGHVLESSVPMTSDIAMEWSKRRLVRRANPMAIDIR